MSQFGDRLHDHEFISDLDALDSAITAATLPDGAPVDALEALDRLRLLATHVRQRLGRIDPILIPNGLLNNMSVSAKTIFQGIQAYSESGDVGQLINANVPADKLLSQLSSAPLVIGGDDVDGLRDALGTFRRASGQYLRHFDEQVASIRAKVDALAKSVEQIGTDAAAQKNRVDNAIAEAQRQTTAFQDQFSKAEESRREQFAKGEESRSEQARQQISQVQQQVSQFQQQFSEAEAKRAERFARSEASRQEAFQMAGDQRRGEFDKHVAALDEEADERQAEWNARIEEHERQIEAHKDRAERLVHVIGNTGMVGGYQKIANQERIARIVWQGIAVGAMVGMIVFAITAFLPTLERGFQWPAFAGRAFVSLTFAALAGYAAQQASKHMSVEGINRRLELELASIDPYLALLPDDKRIEVKTELAARLFGNNEVLTDGGGGGGPLGVDGLLDLLKIAIRGK